MKCFHLHVYPKLRWRWPEFHFKVRALPGGLVAQIKLFYRYGLECCYDIVSSTDLSEFDVKIGTI